MSAAGKPAGSPAVERLRELLGEDLLEHREFRGEHTVLLPRGRVLEALEFLRGEESCDFDYLTDLTAVHYLDREYEFELVYLLYSFRHNRHLRVKTRLAPGEPAPTAVPVWEGANWLEREVYDMFGLVFDGHPDLRRILMPEDYDQHPLRKEIPLKG